MNLTLDSLSILAVVALGMLLTQRILHDYKLVAIFKRYPLPTVAKSGGIIDLEKLYIFVQNFSYRIETRGTVEVEVKNHMVRIVAGTGEVVINLEAWGYLDFYRVRRVVKVVA